MLTASCYSSQCCFTFFCSFSRRLTESICSTNALPIAMHRQTRRLLYSCLRTLKCRTLAHLSFTNTIQTLRILKPLCHPAPGTAAATRPCSQITLGRLVIIIIICRKFEFFISQGSRATCLRWDGQCHTGFVANFIRFLAVQKFWKSVKIWQSYRKFKGARNFFWDTVYILVILFIKLAFGYKHVLINSCLVLSFLSIAAGQQKKKENMQRLQPWWLIADAYQLSWSFC